MVQKLDRALLIAIHEASRSSRSGKITLPSAKSIAAAVTDGGQVTITEYTCLQYGFSNYKWTDAAKAFVVRETHDMRSLLDTST